jgi:hypothetical protein
MKFRDDPKLVMRQEYSFWDRLAFSLIMSACAVNAIGHYRTGHLFMAYFGLAVSFLMFALIFRNYKDVHIYLEDSEKIKLYKLPGDVYVAAATKAEAAMMAKSLGIETGENLVLIQEERDIIHIFPGRRRRAHV